MNSVILIGRICKDAQVKYTQSGVSVAIITIAVDRQFKNKDGKKETDFINCTIIGKEKINDWLLKGKLVAVQGSIQVDRWEKNGSWQTYTKVNVKDIQFLDKKENKQNFEDVSFTENDIPF